MIVILQQDVRGQGKKGQMIDAAEGYARNYLLPRKLAIPATADAINTMNLKEKARRAEEAANRAAAVETADKLRNCTVKITAKGGANGKLFGAITGKEISEALMAQFGLDVGKQKIVLDEPIKAFGSYEIRAKLGYEVSPKAEETRYDIIQTIAFGKPEPLRRFCEGIQSGAPVDSFVTPEPWAMPGYDDPVIMAAGAFVQGASIELSADAPMREPYVCYMQGGLTYSSGKAGILLAAERIKTELQN